MSSKWVNRLLIIGAVGVVVAGAIHGRLSNAAQFSLESAGSRAEEFEKSLSPEMKVVLADVVRNGGTIVECRNRLCEDLSDNESIGNGRDGFYILFKDGPDSDEKMKKFQKMISKLV